MLILSLKLLLAHILGDFVLQSDKAVQHKIEHKAASKYLYGHILIHAVLLGIFLGFGMTNAWIYPTILISHYLIDLIKLQLHDKVNARKLFFYDQLAHIAVLFFCVFIIHPFTFSWEEILTPKVMLLVFFLLVVSFVTGIVMKFIMSKWAFVEDKEEDSLDNAGKYIGMLERLFVFGFIVFNQWQAIGLLIAAKSVLRYSDLSRAKDRKLTEYILIGTLTSFGIAILLGLAYVKLKTLL